MCEVSRHRQEGNFRRLLRRICVLARRKGVSKVEHVGIVSFVLFGSRNRDED